MMSKEKDLPFPKLCDKTRFKTSLNTCENSSLNFVQLILCNYNYLRRVECVIMEDLAKTPISS